MRVRFDPGDAAALPYAEGSFDRVITSMFFTSPRTGGETRRRDANPPARDLDEAATLAALYSRARTSGTAAVDWTRRKHVRRVRRGQPGAVLVERANTLFVVPEPELEERLRVARGRAYLRARCRGRCEVRIQPTTMAPASAIIPEKICDWVSPIHTRSSSRMYIRKKRMKP